MKILKKQWETVVGKIVYKNMLHQLLVKLILTVYHKKEFEI